MNHSRTFYGWYLVAVLWLVYFITVGFIFYGANVINTAMVRDLGMDRKTLGAGFAFFHLIQSGLSAPLAAMLINRKGIRFTLALGCILATAGSLLMATVVASSTLFLAVFGVLIGLGIGLGGVLSVQTGITLWFVRKRALAMSAALTASGIGGFVAAPALNALITAGPHEWKTAWIFVGGLCTVAFLITVTFVKNKPSDLGQVPDGGEEAPKVHEDAAKPHLAVYRTSRHWTPKEALRTRNLWLIFIGIVGFLVPYLFCIAHGVIHLLDRGYAPAAAAMSLGLITLFTFIGKLIGGVLGDRIEPRYVWGASLALMGAGVLIGMNAAGAVSLYLYTILVGTGFGCAFVLMPTVIGNFFGPYAFASIVGIISPLFTLFSSASPFIAGLIYDKIGSYDAAFIGAGLFCLAGMAAILAVKPTEECADGGHKSDQ